MYVYAQSFYLSDDKKDKGKIPVIIHDFFTEYCLESKTT